MRRRVLPERQLSQKRVLLERSHRLWIAVLCPERAVSEWRLRPAWCTCRWRARWQRTIGRRRATGTTAAKLPARQCSVRRQRSVLPDIGHGPVLRQRSERGMLLGRNLYRRSVRARRRRRRSDSSMRGRPPTMHRLNSLLMLGAVLAFSPTAPVAADDGCPPGVAWRQIGSVPAVYPLVVLWLRLNQSKIP